MFTGLLLCLALMLLPAAAGRAALLPQPDAESLKEDALQVAEDMQTGNFAAVTEKFNAEMAAALDEDTLKSGWDSAVAILGDFLETISAESYEQGAYVVVDILEHYENNGMKLHIVYDGEGKIAGMQITYADVEEYEEETQSEDGAAAYTEEEVTVTADERVPLGGTLTLPVDVEKPPVVILVHGSGSSDRDENINGNKPFADIAHGLAARGIAVLRYDKRYYVYPDCPDVGSAEMVTLREESLDDVDAAIKLMQEDARVDGSHIFVLGHSLGGCLCPAIAAEHPQLTGIISMAGSLRPLWEISYDQNQEVIAAAEAGNLTEEQQAQLAEAAEQVEADTKILREDLDNQPDDGMLLGIPARYWKSIKEYCGMNFINEVKMPVLVLQGDADFQVYPEKDYALWQEALGGRDNVVFHLYEGLNHLMMPTQGKRDITEYAVKSHVDTQVIDDIAEFIMDVVK
ncbi:hypothetical protein SAMN05660368_02188 [Marvinbryantia formatexigens]|nr:hypothetical protein SAMN05660368_02188 [Marvinbryantia formatexigens]